MSSAQNFPILLIATNVEKDPYPVFPIGAAMIAAVLEERGHPVRGLDFAFLDDPLAATRDLIAEMQPRLVGISVRAIDNTCLVNQRTYLPAIQRFVRELRQLTSAPIVVGGSGYSLFPDLALDYLEVDYGVVGEGEATVVALVDDLMNERIPQEVPGLRIRRGGSITGRTLRPPLDPDAWYRPSLSCFDVGPHLQAGGMASVQSKRGCPLDCSYCTYPRLEGHGMRLRPPTDVADEIRQLQRQGVDYLFFVDNNFNLPGQHALEICRAMVDRDAIVKWTAFLTPNGFFPELAEAMAASGARSVEFGSESAAAGPLAGLGKHHDKADILACDAACSEAGVTPAHYFIFGGPGETHDSVEESLEVIHRLNGPVVATFAVRIYPQTALRERALEEGQIDADDPLLDPAYYISPEIDAERVIERLTEVASARGNFFVIGHEDVDTRTMVGRLRARGRKGPLWEYLRP